MADEWSTRAQGAIRGTTEEVLERIRSLGDVVRSTAGSALHGRGATVPVVGDLLTALQRLVEQAPAPTVQLDLFLEEIHAKRALINAFQAQLTALDHQMEILEHSLQPVAEWGRQWGRVQDGLADSMRYFVAQQGTDEQA